MEILLGKTAGFCYGVKNAVDKAQEYLNTTTEQIYCIGELVHNEQVTSNLEKKGLKIIDDLDGIKGSAIVRAHGIAKSVYKKAEELNIKLIDLTCPKVLKIHNIAKDFADKGYFIFLIGSENHPEIIGIVSFCGEDFCLLQKEDDVSEAIKKFEQNGNKKLLIISQTTFNVEKFENIVNSIKNKISNNVNLEIKNTICNATMLRQEETESIAKQAEMMIIIGGKNSSNTTKLYDIAKKHLDDVIFAETSEDIDIKYVRKFNKVGIMAGASTPSESIEDVIKFIKK